MCTRPGRGLLGTQQDTWRVVAGSRTGPGQQTRPSGARACASAESYLAATQRCASRGLKSGVVYDALHLVEAERAGADVFLTFNPSDFERLAVGLKPRIVVPPDPPSTQLPP